MLEIRRKFAKDLGWADYNSAGEVNLDGVNDFLRGGFNVYDYEEKVRVLWKNSAKSKIDLGKEETLKYLEHILKRCHSTNIEHVKKEIEAVKENRGLLLFDRILGLFADKPYIELRLE